MVDDFEDFLRAKVGVPKTRETKTSPIFPVFPSKHAVLTECHGEFSDLHSFFSLRALRYVQINKDLKSQQVAVS